ncbi:hypothetical protein FGG65_gp39 [Corynebacterium phage phi673]|uniref:Uncharacterized protein n=2 Tax=Ikedavirus TaxID=2560149 RepID=A0A2H4PJ30_9CAUD|nr:hypothetical protein FGG65_gp39 [Corynebacterium phage phi673]YP_009639771.1 hypothetical protein FGG66_gp36 [Corynebacterium phage phi674]ATW62901.1 hypothetical protein phi673_gp39 [Corynebacterium phage phi673]ATW62954.1 hypothetical protein phi674_gp36 [Corynebacterium phage phi674]
MAHSKTTGFIALVDALTSSSHPAVEDLGYSIQASTEYITVDDVATALGLKS